MNASSTGHPKLESIPETPNIYRRIGRVIARLREEKGLKQEQLGQLVNESVFTISRWENGSRKPKIDDLEKLADSFGVRVSIFFDSGDEPSVADPIKFLNRLSESGKLSESEALEVLEFALNRINDKDD